MKYAFFLLFFIISIEVRSQITMKNTSLVSDTNLLFQNMDNWIKISGTNNKVTIISSNQSIISAYDSNKFIVIPKTMKPDTLLVYSNKKLLLKKIFSIDTLPKLIIQIGNIQKDTATTSEIIANKGLRVIYKGSLYYFPVRIISFRTSFVMPWLDTLATRIKVEGNMFSKQQETLIKQLKINSKIIFDEIRVVTPSSRVRELWPLIMTIK